MSVSQWAKLYGIRRGLLYKRLCDRWEVGQALETPRRKYPLRLERVRDALIDLDVPYEADPRAQAVVKLRPDGLSLEMVGELCGWSREKVRQIEEAALRKIREVQHGGY